MTSPRRRKLVALAAPVVLTMLALGPLSAGLLPSAVAATDIAASPIQVELNTLSPIAPQPDDTLVITGTLHNLSLETVSDLGVQLRLGSPLSFRGTFDQYAEDPDSTLPDDLITIASVTAGQPILAPGASEPFRISVALTDDERERYGLLDNAWQVRELGIAVTGIAGIENQTIGQLRTFLPWAPRDATDTGIPTQVAWIWPLVDRPHRSASGVWFDDALAPELSPGGRLAGLLDAGNAAEDQSPLGHNPKTRNVPVTWAIDPMLLSEVGAMERGYRVEAVKGTTAGAGAAAAKGWLTELQSAATRTDASVISLPYADPDVVAAVRANLSSAIGVATLNGHAALQAALPNAKQLPYGWPFNGLADQPAINALRATGDSTLVLADTALPPTDGPPPVTPSAHTVLTTDEGNVQALLSDSGLDADVDSGVNNPNGSRLSLQEYLAETLMIQAQSPGVQRDMVVAPARRWNPTPAYAAELLADTGKVPWIQPVSLQGVRHSPVYTKVARDPLYYPVTARHSELSSTYLDQVKTLRAEIGDFNAILPQNTPQIRSFTNTEQQALSSAWRGQPKLARAQLASLRGSVNAEVSQVGIASHKNSYVTLTSHGGNVPVTISNNLNIPVRVTVKLVSQRLSLSNNGRVDNVSIPAHQKTVVHVHAAAKTSGVFPVEVQLLTPKGHPYRGTVQLFVRSTVYGTITLVITGAATAALLVAVAIRLTRRALAAKRSTAAAVP